MKRDENSSLPMTAGPQVQDVAPKAATHTPRVPGARVPHFTENVARQKLGKGPEWKMCSWERVGPHDKPAHGAIVRGGSPRILTRGKRKGKESWSHIKDRDMDQTIVTADELSAAQAAYEVETGNCHNCGGGGEQWAGWNHITGTKMRTCMRCDGSGAAKAAAPIEATEEQGLAVSGEGTPSSNPKA